MRYLSVSLHNVPFVFHLSMAGLPIYGYVTVRTFTYVLTPTRVSIEKRQKGRQHSRAERARTEREDSKNLLSPPSRTHDRSDDTLLPRRKRWRRLVRRRLQTPRNENSAAVMTAVVRCAGMTGETATSLQSGCRCRFRGFVVAPSPARICAMLTLRCRDTRVGNKELLVRRVWA